MKKIYLCINLNEFHANQKDVECGTRTTIKFVSASNQQKAESIIHELYPKTAWFVIDKAYADKRMVCADID